MEAYKVLDIYNFLKNNDIHIIIDGGWAVDALIGEQTRRHDDLDIAMSHKDTPKLRKLLAEFGFVDFPRPDTWECNFVLKDRNGNKLDVHTFLFDQTGKNIFGVPYEQKHFGGKGMINGQTVDCINPESLLEFHTGYEVDEKDYQDVKRLCEKFNFKIPKDYLPFIGEQID